MRIIASLFVLSAALALGPVHAADPLSEPHVAAVIAATEAADALSALCELDFFVLDRDKNRDQFTQLMPDGETLVDSRQRQRQKTETVVLAMGEVVGNYAELSLLVRELWHLADAEAALITGVEPIDDVFLARTKELSQKTKAIRTKMRPLLPTGVELPDPDPGVAF